MLFSLMPNVSTSIQAQQKSQAKDGDEEEAAFEGLLCFVVLCLCIPCPMDLV